MPLGIHFYKLKRHTIVILFAIKYCDW